MNVQPLKLTVPVYEGWKELLYMCFITMRRTKIMNTLTVARPSGKDGAVVKDSQSNCKVDKAISLRSCRFRQRSGGHRS